MKFVFTIIIIILLLLLLLLLSLFVRFVLFCLFVCLFFRKISQFVCYDYHEEEDF